MKQVCWYLFCWRYSNINIRNARVAPICAQLLIYIGKTDLTVKRVYGHIWCLSRTQGENREAFGEFVLLKAYIIHQFSHA